MIDAMKGPKPGQVWRNLGTPGMEVQVLVVGEPLIVPGLLPGEAPARWVLIERFGRNKKGLPFMGRSVSYYRFNGKAGGFAFVRESK